MSYAVHSSAPCILLFFPTQTLPVESWLFPGYQALFVWIPSYSHFRPLVLGQSNLYPLPRGERVGESKNPEDLVTCIGENPSRWDIDAPGPSVSLGSIS